MKRKPKALVLFSGGLDSRLATMMMREQLGQKNVELVFFALPFGGGCCNDRFCSIKFSQLYGMKLHVIDCTKGAMFRKYMAVIKKPRFSRGVAFNPCIDCHLFMLKEAGKLASRLKADFLVTGEVVGERPLSQNRHAMGIIEKEAGLVGKVLRPLSAKLMEETVAEKKGWVEREKLLAINGKKRSEQMALAKSYGIEFPMPAGGCVLTDVEYSRRLVNIMKYSPDPGIEELALVRLGRHFVSGKSTVIVGRNREENERLLELSRKLKLPSFEAEGHPGPITLIVSKSRPDKKTAVVAAKLTARYSDCPKGSKCTVNATSGKKVSRLAVIAPHDSGSVAKSL